MKATIKKEQHNNPNVALVSNIPVVNLSLRHIQTMQEAQSMGCDLITAERDAIDSLTIDIESEKVNIGFEDGETLHVSLSDYEYVLYFVRCA